jgi:hypothetical protein
MEAVSSACQRRPAAPRKSCTWRTAIAALPTAEGTRFTEPLRTSPTARTPGRPAFPAPACLAEPVRTNPFSSRGICPWSHVVCGVDPMRTKIAVASRGRTEKLAPNLRAWTTARSARSAPEMPVGKPR